MSKYPDWVNQFKTKGTSIKKVGDSYYLYSNTSIYVKGKKYPQPIQSFIGVITPDGVIETHKRKVSLTNIEVFEYGFTTAILSLCPSEWKKQIGKDWYDVLCHIILSHSNLSFVLHKKSFKEIDQDQYDFQAQEVKLFQELEITVDELESLKTIFALSIDHKIVLAKISASQQEILNKYKIVIITEYQ